MIASAKTLFLATLVFNAATVFGAPIRNVDTSSESVARAEMNTPVQPVARARIVDVPDNRRRSLLGHITRRSARLVSERDEPLPEAVVVREPAPVVDVVAPIVKARRYPRQALHDRHEIHEKRKPAVTVVGMTNAPAPVVERRYPRRILHDLYEKREPATSIKETTKVVEKITILDTPEDALAFNANNPDKSLTASSSVSTLVSISVTTTLASDGSVPTATPTDSVSATPTVTGSVSATDSVSATPTATDSVSASPTDSSASPTATSDASATTDSASATATPTASSTSTATDSTITASPTSTASSGDPTASASSTSSADGAEATPPANGDPITVVNPPPAGAGGDANPVRRGIYIRASTEPILRRVAFSGASWASSIRRQLNSH